MIQMDFSLVEGAFVAKRIITILLALLGALLAAALAYVAYVMITYERLPDNLALAVDAPLAADEAAPVVSADEEFTVVTANLGFGAYNRDFDFFMDGGGGSVAESPEVVREDILGSAEALRALSPDFVLFQEVDIDGTRSHHIDEYELLRTQFPSDWSVFCQNYDSPYLMYPLLRPHGASRSGLLTLSSAAITSAGRVELPVEGGFMKLLDLDRCYSVSRIPAEGGKELVLYNLHLSAYTSDGTIATEQLKLLLADMQSEYDAGNWCVAGGDFNKDLLGDSAAWFGEADQEYSWAQPIPAGTFEGLDISLVTPLDKDDPVPSCRNADGPYHQGQYVLTVDGFLVTANVTAESAVVIDTGFAWSDHNPVAMTFTLRP